MEIKKSTTSGQIIEAIEKSHAKYISFDMFDTLIFRCTDQPTDVFKIVEKKYHLKDFKAKRLYAEMQARKASAKEDVSLDDIYHYYVGNPSDVKYEKKTEIDCCFPNPVMQKVVQWCNENNKRILVITDMYLDITTLRSMLEKCGYHFDTIYVSGMCGLSKQRSGLFSKVIEDLHISSNELLHIGDNDNSDYAVPESLGIQCFHYEGNDVRYDYYLKDNDESLFRNYLRKSAHRDTIAYRIGYGIVGPYITSFSKWIHDKHIQDKVDVLLFVAREGFLIEKIYKKLFPDEEEKIKYVRLNKNVVRMPYLKRYKSVEALQNTLPQSVTFSWETILHHFKLPEDVYKKAANVIGEENLKEEFPCAEMKSESFQQKYKKVMDSIGDYVSEQELLFKDYMNELTQSDKEKSVALVNNSINGNLQFILKKIFPDMKISAYQFIQSEECKTKNQNCRSKIGGGTHDHVKYALIFRDCLVLEHLLFEQCGTAIRFAQDGNKTYVETENQGAEKENNKILDEIQDAALDFAEQYSLIQNIVNGDILELPFYRMLLNPKEEDAEVIGDFIDYDVLGTTKLIPDRNLGTWKMLCHSELFRYSKWPQGYLRLNSRSRLLRAIYSKYIERKLSS